MALVGFVWVIADSVIADFAFIRFGFGFGFGFGFDEKQTHGASIQGISIPVPVNTALTLRVHESRASTMY